MKLVSLLLFGTMMHASASTFGQKISINVKQASFQEVLEAIQKQTNYDFLYNNAHLRNLEALDLFVKNKDFTEVLNKVLTPNGLVYALDNNIVLIKPKEELGRDELGVQQVVQGYVKDANNQPIIGATVSLANSNLATATDANGYFRLSVPVQSGNLIVTALGFTSRTLAFQQGQVLQVGLSASLSGLDEVIIVGDGTQKKELVTSAIGSFKVKDEDVRQVASPTRLL